MNTMGLETGIETSRRWKLVKIMMFASSFILAQSERMKAKEEEEVKKEDKNRHSTALLLNIKLVYTQLLHTKDDDNDIKTFHLKPNVDRQPRVYYDRNEYFHRVFTLFGNSWSTFHLHKKPITNIYLSYCQATNIHQSNDSRSF